MKTIHIVVVPGQPAICGKDPLKLGKDHLWVTKTHADHFLRDGELANVHVCEGCANGLAAMEAS